MSGPGAGAPRPRGRAATRAVQRHGGGGARRTLVRVIGAGAALVLVVLLVHGLRRAAGTRSAATPPPEGPLAVVEGDVPEPGAVVVAPGATVGDLVEAAGGDPDELDAARAGRVARPWTRLAVAGGTVTITELTVAERFAAGGTLDPNHAGADELAQVPGLSGELAGRVVDGRDEGPYCAIEDLERVRGIGPRKVEWVRPFLAIEGSPRGCPASP